MNILGNSIKELRKEKGLTQKELAQLTGFKQNTISNHENGKRQLDETDIRIYADALNVAPQDLFDFARTTPTTLSAITDTASKLTEPRQAKVLVFAQGELDEQERASQEVREDRVVYMSDYRETIELTVDGVLSAGTGIWQEDNLGQSFSFYTDEIPDEDDYDTIALVEGNSMEPKIKNGDYLFIRLTPQPELNSLAAFQVDGENYVKKYKGTYLESLNPNYDDIDITEDTRAIGQVVEIYREG